MDRCVLCGSPSERLYEQCPDLLHGVAGRWDYRRCGSCGTFFMDPLPSPQEIPAFYPSTYFTHVWFDKNAGVFDLRSFRTRVKLAIWESCYGYRGLLSNLEAPVARWSATRLALVPWLVRWVGIPIGFFPFQSGGRLLDLGCGNGDFLVRAQKLGWLTEGLESDPAAADIARSRGLVVKDGILETADFEEASFDAIMLSHVLEHLIAPAETLGRIVRWLKPGGTLVTITPNPASISAAAYGRYWFSLDAPRHLVIPSPLALERLMRAVSLRPEIFSIAHPGVARSSIARMKADKRRRPWYGPLVPWLEKFPTLPGRLHADNTVCVAVKPR